MLPFAVPCYAHTRLVSCQHFRRMSESGPCRELAPARRRVKAGGNGHQCKTFTYGLMWNEPTTLPAVLQHPPASCDWLTDWHWLMWYWCDIGKLAACPLGQASLPIADGRSQHGALRVATTKAVAAGSGRKWKEGIHSQPYNFTMSCLLFICLS